MKKTMKRKPFDEHFSMMQTYTLADFVTLGNGCCGAGIILFCLQYLDEQKEDFITYAFLLFPLAVLFDVMDGWVARFRHQQSILGADLDSLADQISFGVAPAVLGFTLGLRGLYDCLLLLFYICCAMSRLARYNAQRTQMTDKDTGKITYHPTLFFLDLFSHPLSSPLLTLTRPLPRNSPSPSLETLPLPRKSLSLETLPLPLLLSLTLLASMFFDLERFFRGFPTPFACLIVVLCLAIIRFPTSFPFTTLFQQLFHEKMQVLAYDFHPFSTLYFFVGCGMISSSIKIPHL